MDIERLDRLRSKNNFLKVISMLLIFIAVLVGYWFYENYHKTTVQYENLWVAQVEKGDLVLSAKASGKIKTIASYIITSKVSGTVVKINKDIGELVKKNDVVLIIESEVLRQRVRDTQNRLNQAQAKHSILLADLNIQKLNIETEIFKIENTIEMQKLKLNAKEILNKKGIISEIDFSQARLEVISLEKELSFAKKKFKSFDESKESKILSDLLIVEQLKQQLEIELKLIENMTIRATKRGVITKINVGIGEHVDIEQSIVELNDNSKFNATLYVNEAFANKIQYNQKVEVEILDKIVEGHIKTINPQVKNNAIEIEVKFDNDLPKGARADMNISGLIIFNTLINTLWVTKPQGVQTEQKYKVFVLDKDKNYARKKEVMFGKSSNNRVQILEGLTQGQNVILNELDEISQKFERIEIR